MESDKVNRWLTLGANIGVIVGLLLLVFEIRQNTIAVQTNARQQHFDQHTTLVLARLENPVLLQALMKGSDGLEDLSNEDRAYFIPYTVNVFRNHFIAHDLWQNGILPDSQWNTLVTSIKATFRTSKGAREYWRRRQENEPDEYSIEFVEFIDEILLALEKEAPQGGQ
jgi:hypothetical protein